MEVYTRLNDLASALGRSTKSLDKVLVSAELAKVICEDLGEVFFMSEDLAEVGIPYATGEDAYTLARVALASVEEVLAVYEEAMEVLKRRYVDLA